MKSPSDVVFTPPNPNLPRGEKFSILKNAKKVKDTLVIKSLSGLRGLLTSITPNLTVTLPSNRKSSLYTSSTLNILEHHKINFNFITELFRCDLAETKPRIKRINLMTVISIHPKSELISYSKPYRRKSPF